MKFSIAAAVISDKGLNPKYAVNEDSYLLLNKEGVFAVADGVGGSHAGDIASRSALRIIEKSIAQFSEKYKGNGIDFLRKMIAAGNDAVYQMSLKMNKQMASTIAIMSVEEGCAVLGHVGDSRIYLFRNGKILQLTRDHSKLQELLDKNPQLSITRESYRDGHVITKALGIEQEIQPDLQKVFLKPDDVFIICTDGIYSYNSENELIGIISKNRNDLKTVCENLKSNCYLKGARDNLTAVVVRIAG